MKKEDDAMPAPKEVLRLTRWRWWMLATSVPGAYGLLDWYKHPHLSAHHMASWEAPFVILGLFTSCLMAALVWYTHFYWKRQTP